MLRNGTAEYVVLSRNVAFVLVIICYCIQECLGDPGPVLAKCCALGVNFAREKKRCHNFPAPVSEVPLEQQAICITSASICCLRVHREEHCQNGKRAALLGEDCFRERGEGAEFFKDCCDGCKLGIMSGNSPEGCALRGLSFGFPWDAAYVECCSQVYSSKESLELHSDSALNDNRGDFTGNVPDSDNLCKLFPGQLCGHICVPTIGSYECRCRAGFKLSSDLKTCIQDHTADRCLQNNPCEQICKDTGVSIECSCNLGYELAIDQRSCLDIDECTFGVHMCKAEEQTCYNEIGSYSCVNSDGSFVSGQSIFASSFSGSLGGLEVLQDLDQVAELGGESFVSSGFRRCPPGYHFNVETLVCDDIDECAVGIPPCAMNSICDNTIGSFTCTRLPIANCPPGYTFDLSLQSCVDTDECAIATDNCNRELQFCLNTQGSFTCEDRRSSQNCPAGFKYNSLTKTCEDVNECAENLHGCESDVEVCRNTNGGYECDIKCDEGFKFSHGLRNCIDIDECVEEKHTCKTDEEICINEIGAFTCQSIVQRIGDLSKNELPQVTVKPSVSSSECPQGFQMDFDSEKCLDIDECNFGLHNCSSFNDGCINTLGSFICHPRKVCPRGFSRNTLSGRCEDSNECTLGTASCLPGQICVNTHGSYECQVECQDGFVYSDSNLAICVDIDECDEQPCANMDVCVNTEGSYFCVSSTNGTTQRQCTLGFRMDSLLKICKDVDECRENVHYCQLEIEDCINTEGGFECRSKYCPPGHSRTSDLEPCEDINECALPDNPCRNSKDQCVNTQGSFHCRPGTACPRGFTWNNVTSRCVDIDECVHKLDDCIGGEKCINQYGHYACRVSPGECRVGFRYHTPSKRCRDIDECVERLDSCERSTQSCENAIGSYRCVDVRPSCNTGYTFSEALRACIDIDECKEGSDRCNGSQVCINTLGSYHCQNDDMSPLECLPGFVFNKTARVCVAFPRGFYPGSVKTDINECSEHHDCTSDEVCVNKRGTYECIKAADKNLEASQEESAKPDIPRCQPGFEFSQHQGCVDINECEADSDYCNSESERCVNLPGAYRCEAIVPTTESPLKVEDNLPLSPQCPVGFIYNQQYKSCIDINECVRQPCGDNRRCTNVPGTFACECLEGFREENNDCIDNDECKLLTDNCSSLGPQWECVNTRGSFRCTKKTCPSRQILAADGTCIDVICSDGFRLADSGCIDVNECQEFPSVCKRNERCINAEGSYRCLPKLNCGAGYQMNEIGTKCIDVDECTTGEHQCTSDQICINKIGSYICRCPEGYQLTALRQCEDIDECKSYYGNVCSGTADCENTPGSFRCVCKKGFQKTTDTNVCTDYNECEEIPGVCHHECSNTWGSFQCSCRSGFRLAPDNRTCIDVDECEEVKSRGRLCIGFCRNVPGSFKCECPNGYTLSSDERTCRDVNECERLGICNTEEICVNTRGSHRCNQIHCLPDYVRDTEFKNRCKRKSFFCRADDSECRRQPLSYSYNYLPLVSNLTLPDTGEVDIFTMRGPRWSSTSVHFELTLESVQTPVGIPEARREYFLLKRTELNQAVISLVRSIIGPQQMELALKMLLYEKGQFGGSAVAKLLIYVSEFDF